MIELYAEKGADFFKRNNNGDTALQLFLNQDLFHLSSKQTITAIDLLGVTDNKISCNTNKEK